MIIISMLFATAAWAGTPEVKWEATKDPYMDGGSFKVHIEIKAPADGGEIASWMLEPAAFTINGKPLVERRGNHPVALAPNTTLALDLDIGPMIAQSKGFDGKNFKLSYAKEQSSTPEIEVSYMQTAEKGLDFMKMPVDQLANYHVMMQTNRGNLEIEFWPDVAPNHVRNFLDLCYTGFYNGTPFHRVIPGFMIQGGDPTGTGTGSGPRQLKAEFNNRKHEAGVLSMARSASPDSASCQFFVMHARSPHLDGQYSAFGKLVSGLDVVEKIVNTKRNSADKPLEPQTIVKATVIKIPAPSK